MPFSGFFKADLLSLPYARSDRSLAKQRKHMHLARKTGIIEEDAECLAKVLAPAVSDLSGATLLVTGAGGFLCSFLLDVVVALNEFALSKPCMVIALDSFKSGVPERIEHLQNRSDIVFTEHDVRNKFVTDKQIDYIIHGASIASPIFYRRFPLDTIDVNVQGTRHMLDLSSQARSMLYLSTSEIYGDPDPNFIPTPETYWGNVSCTGPRACYDESKRLAETLCSTYFRLYGTPIKVARPFNVYGPGQRIDDGRIIPDLMQAALKKETIVLFGDGKATRSFCYVSDAIKSLFLLLVSPHNGEAFNIGNDEEEMPISKVAQLVSEIASSPPLPVTHQASSDTDYLKDNPQRRKPDLTKLRTMTTYVPDVGLREGLERTLKSYRSLVASVKDTEIKCT